MRARFGCRCLVALFAVCCAARPARAGELEDLLKNGAALSQQADYAKAIPLLRRATQIAPQNYSANLLLGVALLKSGHPRDAIAPLQIAVTANPADSLTEGYLGDAAMEQSNFALAAEAFQAALARSPSSEQALVWWTDYSLERYRVLGLWLRSSQRGRATVLRSKAEMAAAGTTAREAFLREAAETDPEQRGIWGELGIAQAQLGINAQAEINLKKALEREPEDSFTLELGALVDAAHGNWPQAGQKLMILGQRSQSNLQKALAAWPRKLIPDQKVDGAVWQCLRSGSKNCVVEVASQENGSLSAERLFQEGRWEILAAMPPPDANHPSEWFWRGTAMAQLGDCPGAIPALERGLNAGAEVAGSELADCYQSEVVHTADRLAAEGKEGAVHQIRGDILLSVKRDPSAAAMEYTKALLLKPENPELLEKLAEAYFSLGDMDRAQQSAQEALKQDPHRELALRLLVRVAMSNRDYATALSMLGRLAEIEPEDAWMRVEQGTAYAQTGRPEDAVQRLTSALEAGYPDERGALHAMLAVQLRKLGREQEAQSATDEAIKLEDAFQEHVQNNVDIDEHK